MGGILGPAVGESPAEAQARIEEAKKNATDLTGLIRRKGKATETADTSGDDPTESTGTATNGKRKAEDLEPEEAGGSKKAKVEDAVDE